MNAETEALLADLPKAVTELAKRAALAVRIEPELIRALRLALVPDADVSAEADFWLGSLSVSRSSNRMVLLPDVAETLRARLLAENGLGELRRARRIVERVHHTAPPAILLEEELLYLGLVGDAASRNEIERRLLGVLNAIAIGGRLGLKDWAIRALPGLPRSVRDSPPAVALQMVIGQGAAWSPSVTRFVPFPIDIALLRSIMPWTDLHVRLVPAENQPRPDSQTKHQDKLTSPSALRSDWTRDTGPESAPHALEVSLEQLAGSHSLRVPKTRPIFVEVSDRRTVRSVQVPEAGVWRHQIVGDVEIRTAARETHRLMRGSVRADPQGTESTAGPSIRERLRPGRKVGVYVLEKRLGAGGFGEVWLGNSPNGPVALKFHYVPTQNNLRDALKETELWKDVSGHENIARFIEAFEEDGQLVIVSEYAGQGTLGQLLREREALPLDEAVRLMLGILSGLDHLHSKRIIHGDLKPHNILMNLGRPQLVDFGLAHRVDDPTPHQVAGTVQYMSPESFEGSRAVAADIWSAGVIFYELLSGHHPFHGDERPDLIRAIRTDPPSPLPPSIPPALSQVALAALSKAPEYRPSAMDMWVALKNWMPTESLQQPGVKPTEPPTPKTDLPRNRE